MSIPDDIQGLLLEVLVGLYGMLGIELRLANKAGTLSTLSTPIPNTIFPFGFWATPCSAHGLFLTLCSGITPDRFRESCGMPRIKSRSVPARGLYLSLLPLIFLKAHLLTLTRRFPSVLPADSHDCKFSSCNFAFLGLL